MKELVKGSTFTRIFWPTHRPNAMLQELHEGDFMYNKSDGRYIKHYKVNDKDAKGVSCFVPLESPHNVSNESLSKAEIPCYFLPEGTSLSEGLALFYTHTMKLRFPPGVQKGLHFVIAPTMRMTKKNYEHKIRELGWQLCTIKASAEMNELISRDDDLDGVEDFRMNELYWLMEIWHMQTMYPMDRLHANDIHTWIALDKPSFQDLLQHEPRAYIVFSTLAHMNAIIPVSHVTELIYLGDILGELEDVFGWKRTEFCAQASEGEDIRNWNQNQVIKKDALNLDEKYIKKIQEQEINGSVFLLLTEKYLLILIRTSGPFEFSYGPVIVIIELVNTLRAREEKLDKQCSARQNMVKIEDIIRETIKCVR